MSLDKLVSTANFIGEDVDTVISAAIVDFGLVEPIVEVGSGDTARGQRFCDCLRVDVVQPKDSKADVLADAHFLPFRDNVIGTVFCFETLEHLTNPIQAFREFARVLKAEGRVYVTAVFVWVYHAHPVDYWRFTMECVGMLMRQAGLEPLKVLDYRASNYFIDDVALNDHVIGVATK